MLTNPIGDLCFHKASKAFAATFSNTGSPVKWLNVPNSIINVATPAVQVIGVSPSGTPYCKFTVPNGIPVLVSNAKNKY